MSFMISVHPIFPLIPFFGSAPKAGGGSFLDILLRLCLSLQAYVSSTVSLRSTPPMLRMGPSLLQCRGWHGFQRHMPIRSVKCLCINAGDQGVAGKGHEWKNHGRPWPCEREGPKLRLGGMKRSGSFYTVPPGCGARRLEIQTSPPTFGADPIKRD